MEQAVLRAIMAAAVAVIWLTLSLRSHLEVIMQSRSVQVAQVAPAAAQAEAVEQLLLVRFCLQMAVLVDRSNMAAQAAQVAADLSQVVGPHRNSAAEEAPMVVMAALAVHMAAEAEAEATLATAVMAAKAAHTAAEAAEAVALMLIHRAAALAAIMVALAALAAIIAKQLTETQEEILKDCALNSREAVMAEPSTTVAAAEAAMVEMAAIVTDIPVAEAAVTAEMEDHLAATAVLM